MCAWGPDPSRAGPHASSLPRPPRTPPGSPAGPALPMPFQCDIRIALVIWVALRAVRLASLAVLETEHRAVSGAVFGVRPGGQMAGIHASTVRARRAARTALWLMAEMVDLLAFRHWAERQFVRHAVRGDHDPVAPGLAVAIESSTGPPPALVVLAALHAGPESLHERQVCTRTAMRAPLLVMAVAQATALHCDPASILGTGPALALGLEVGRAVAGSPVVVLSA